MMALPLDWQLRRSDFNHQWLKNRLLSALDMADHVIHGRISGLAYLQELIEVELAEWQERMDELDALLTDFESEMSPRRLVESLAFCTCEPAAREVLGELMHTLWLVRYPVANWLQSATRAAVEVNAHYKRLCEISPVDVDGRLNPDFAAKFEEFRAACRLLSTAIEKLPNRILVT